MDMPAKVDVSIISNRHRSNIKATLRKALLHGNQTITIEARFQIIEEELAKLILETLESIDDEEDEL